MKNTRKIFISIIISTFLGTAHAEMIGLDCTANPSQDGHVWKYNIEYDKNTGRGLTYGNTFGGDPFALTTSVHYQSEKIINFITNNPSNGSVTKGTIDRKSLGFSYGGSEGICKVVPIKKREFKEKPKGAAI